MANLCSPHTPPIFVPSDFYFIFFFNNHCLFIPTHCSPCSFPLVCVCPCLAGPLQPSTVWSWVAPTWTGTAWMRSTSTATPPPPKSHALLHRSWAFPKVRTLPTLLFTHRGISWVSKCWFSCLSGKLHGYSLFCSLLHNQLIVLGWKLYPFFCDLMLLQINPVFKIRLAQSNATH